MEHSSASPSKPCHNFLHEALRGVLHYLGFETKTQQAADHHHQLPADKTDEEDQHDDDVHKNVVSISLRALPKRSDISRGGGARIN